MGCLPWAQGCGLPLTDGKEVQREPISCERAQRQAVNPGLVSVLMLTRHHHCPLVLAPYLGCRTFLVASGCESWTIKKTERQRIDAFVTVVLEKNLESPLDCKEI